MFLGSTILILIRFVKVFIDIIIQLAVAVNGHGMTQVVYVGFVEGQVAMGMALLSKTLIKNSAIFIMTQILVQ